MMFLVRLAVVLAAVFASTSGQLGHAGQGFDRKAEVYRVMLEESGKKAWRDPYDMFGFDEEDPHSAKIVDVPLDNNVPTTKVEKEFNDEKIQPLENSPLLDEELGAKNCVSRDMVFLTRWLNILHGKLNHRGFIDVGDSVVISLKVTKTRISQMRSILNAEQVNLKDIEDLFVDSMSDLSVSSDVSWFTMLFDNIFHLQDAALILTLISFVILCAVITRISFFKKLSLLFFFTWFWHWMKLYKEAIASRHAKLEQIDFPSVCHQRNLSIWTNTQLYLKSFFIDLGDCNEYYKNIMVDPILDANPIKALADFAFTVLFLPLDSLSFMVNRCVKNLFSELAFGGRITAASMMILILIFAFGYSIKLPWFLGAIEPGKRSILSPLTEFVSTVVNIFQGRPVQYIQQGNSSCAKIMAPANQVQDSPSDYNDESGHRNRDESTSVPQICEESVTNMKVITNITRTGTSPKRQEEVIVQKSLEFPVESIVHTSNDEINMHEKTDEQKLEPLLVYEINPAEDTGDKTIFEDTDEDFCVLNNKQLKDILKISEE